MARTGFLTAFLFLFALLGPSSIAFAAIPSDYGCTDGTTLTCDQGEAYAAASAYVNQQASDMNASNGTTGYVGCIYPFDYSFVARVYGGSCGNGSPRGTATFYWLSSKSCSTKENLQGSFSWTSSSLTVCDGGCGYEPIGSSVSVLVAGKMKTYVMGGEGLKPTGNACASSDGALDATPKTEDCQPVTGQTLCSRADGTVCATASNGKKLCWDPGATGNKTSGDTLAIRQAGTEHIAPNTMLISGDTLSKTGGPDTVVTSSTSGGSTTTTTTNITTYNTTNGTNAGSSDQSEGSGEDDKGNSASGGGDCKTAPVVTGDAALGMVATQAWATRCAVEAGNSTKVTGDIGDCKSAFSVAGDNAQAHQLRAMRAERCGDAPQWTNVSGMSQDPGLGQSGDDIPGISQVSVTTDDLDESGFGGGQCIGFATGGSSGVASGFLDTLASPPALWCNYIAVLKGVFVLVGAVAASYILTRSQ